MKVYKVFKLNDIICLKLQITYFKDVVIMLDINFNQIIEIIEKRKNNAYRKVNEEMILLYLEIGKDFTFIGDEYRVQVGNHDFFIDLLFYNRELSCLVEFELKLGEFKAEYLGKMNLYLKALYRDVKKNKRIQVLELYYVVLKMKMLLNIQLVKTCLRL